MKRRENNQTITCEWCGERRECSRAGVKTCGAKCRNRLSLYTRRVGFPPDEPPGNITVQVAFELLVLELLAREKARREYAAVVNAQAAKLLAARTAHT